MTILFEVEKFGNPKTDNILLDVFLEVKTEILKSLIDSKDRFKEIYIVIIITPSEPLKMKFLTCGSKVLVKELNEFLNERMDLSKIAERILSPNSN